MSWDKQSRHIEEKEVLRQASGVHQLDIAIWKDRREVNKDIGFLAWELITAQCPSAYSAY